MHNCLFSVKEAVTIEVFGNIVLGNWVFVIEMFFSKVVTVLQASQLAVV